MPVPIGSDRADVLLDMSARGGADVRTMKSETSVLAK